MVKDVQSHTIDSPYIRDVLPFISYDSILVLDLDNTVIEPSNQITGSDTWFVSYIKYASHILADKNEAIISGIVVYDALQKNIHMQPVEQTIVTIIKALQKIGIPVIALTARGPELEQSTLRQLDEVGINLHDNIIFCEGRNKGECLRDYLLSLDKMPANVVMADDKVENITNVKNAIEKLGLHFDGLRYSNLDEKVKSFNMRKAQAELISIKDKLPFESQLIINKLSIFSRNHLRDRRPSLCNTERLRK